MATSQTASVNIDVLASATKNNRSTTANIRDNRQLANGTTTSQADKAYYDQITIAASGSPQSLDFAGGGLIDVNGDTITWVEITTLVVKAASTNTVNVVVGGGTNAMDVGIGVTATNSVQPGETKVLCNTGGDPAYPITAGSADVLKLSIASGTNQVIEVLAIGRSA